MVKCIDDLVEILHQQLPGTEEYSILLSKPVITVISSLAIGKFQHPSPVEAV